MFPAVFEQFKALFSEGKPRKVILGVVLLIVTALAYSWHGQFLSFATLDEAHKAWKIAAEMKAAKAGDPTESDKWSKYEQKAYAELTSAFENRSGPWTAGQYLLRVGFGAVPFFAVAVTFMAPVTWKRDSGKPSGNFPVLAALLNLLVMLPAGIIFAASDNSIPDSFFGYLKIYLGYGIKGLGIVFLLVAATGFALLLIMMFVPGRPVPQPSSQTAMTPRPKMSQ